MKLYLSSYRAGNNPKQLENLFKKGKKVAVIPNALDVYTDIERRQQSLKREMDRLTGLALEPEVLDLRDYFDKKEQLNIKMESFDGLWVLGGNTFVLRRAFRESGLDEWLESTRNSSEFVYAGYSAGICVLTKDLKNIELMDDPNVNPEGYPPGLIYDGLGIIDFAIVPHFESDHPETEAASRQVEYLISNNIEYKTLKDGDVLIIETS
jgi:dipeptidase E